MSHDIVASLDVALSALPESDVATLIPALQRVLVRHGLILERVAGARKTAVPFTQVVTRLEKWFAFGSGYHELAMFADDVWFDVAADILPARVSFDGAVVRIAPGEGPRPSDGAARTARGEALLLKGGTAFPVLGVLVGKPIGNPPSADARHVFVMMWDGALLDWRSPDEGQSLLVRWTKKVLLAWLDKEKPDAA